jgi:nanoRNase/pAp phosphatase (c-di-AMP/oligoRNAs hydrolase)
MKCLAVCRDEGTIRLLDRTLKPRLDVEFVVEDRLLGRRLDDAGIAAHVGNPRRVDTWLKADVGPATCVIVEDSPRRSPGKTIETIRDAGATLVYLLDAEQPRSPRQLERQRQLIASGVTRLALADLLRGALGAALERSITRARVEQYQRYLADADRILILLHNDPDPDAMASGLALRTLLRRTRTTAIIGTFQPATRPENLRMANLLDIKIEVLNRRSLNEFPRIATVDVQPHYFGGLLNRVDLVIDHHPARAGYSAAFKDIRPDYGSTCTILTEHLRAVDANISERTATAMLYAIKSDTLFLSRHTDESDLDAFRFLYPLANAALVRKMEGSETNLERLACLSTAMQRSRVDGALYTSHLGEVEREDLITFVADFLLQVDEISWSVVTGIVRQNVVISARHLGESGDAGKFVRRSFGDIGSAGGHRVMAKAVAPVDRFIEKFGSVEPDRVLAVTHALAEEFLQAPSASERRRGAEATAGPAV